MKSRACNLRCSQTLVQVAQDSYPYFAVSLGTGPVIPPGTGVPFLLPLTALEATLEVHLPASTWESKAEFLPRNVY
jgi:hypothetical protein